MSETRPPFKSGFVGLAGVPNAGKSTLMNRLIGQKVSITSKAPQTTRHRIAGILTDERMQAIFVDVPGILATEEKFNKRLVECARDSLCGCDIILHLRTAESHGRRNETRVIEMLGKIAVPVWEVWNKMDLGKPIPAAQREASSLQYKEIFFISAKTGRGLPGLLDAVAAALPEGPALYPEEDLSDRNLRFLCAELVREQIFRNLRQEVPYGVATLTEGWEEPDSGGSIHIEITIQTEREAHKGILIGAKGAMLKKIGTAARHEIEKLCGKRVFLDLRVRVRPKWRKNEQELKRFGLDWTDTS